MMDEMYGKDGECSKETKIKVLKELVEMLGGAAEDEDEMGMEKGPKVAIEIEKEEKPMLG